MDDKAGKLEATEYIAVTLEEDGKMLGDLMMPAEALEGLSQEEITRQVFAAHKRLRVADQMLNRQRIKEDAMVTGPELMKSLAQMVAGLIALDVRAAWKERGQQDAEEVMYLEGPVKEPDSLGEMAKAFEEPLLKMWQEDRESEDLTSWLWQHLIAGAISELEDEHGIETVRTMTDERFDALLHKQLFEAQDFTAAVANLLGLYAQVWAQFLTEGLDLDNTSLPELRQWLGIGADSDTDLQGAMQVRAERFEDFFSIPSGAPYYALQEIMATKDFHQLDGIPWPTALIDKKSAKGTAQLRPATMDENPLMAPDEVDEWAKIMWWTRDQLSDLDVDVMDSLAAIYLQQTRQPGEDAVTGIDDILAMRGLKPKRGGSGTRGGYTPKQRQEAQAALTRIQSIWLDMAEVDAYEDTERGGRRRSRKTIQSRPFVITDRIKGQMRLDGFMDVERFIFRPGRVFAHYLHGPGRQTALLNAKILNFDPYRETWEKRLGRYLTNLWRIRARSGAYMEPLRIQTLLKVVDQELNSRRGGWIRERLEKALDALLERGIINAWQYDRWDEDTTQQRNWFESWMQATVLIEPPDKIEEHYQELERPAKAEALPATSKEPLGTRLKARRQQLGLTQLQAAEELEISQGYYSQLERGKNRAKPGAALGNRIDRWLGGP
ncbi:MAG: helix-turn-helix transcriptional regulator [Firmicutes bacterium]|nr:helix-turn-helix transcriptional regulator [Bacillota bacterium]